MSITQFTMEEVRCFAGKQTLEIRPLTFLVGENSTGKTTALGCFHVLANYFQGRGIDFNSNSHPYSMGTFNDIVRNSKNKEKTFKLGYAYKYDNEIIKVTIEFTQKTNGFEPIVSSLVLQLNDGKITFNVDDSMEMEVVLATSDEKQNHYQFNTSSEMLNDYPPYLFLRSSQSESDGGIAFSNYLKKKYKTARKRRFEPFEPLQYLPVFSGSPIRSRPERIYFPTREFNDPEGSDVVTYLMRIEATEKKDWQKLKQQLEDFGKSSGLFQNIKIKRYGRSFGDRFELRFKVRGPTSNIIDVGYGISQILPYYSSQKSTYIQEHKQNSLPCWGIWQNRVISHLSIFGVKTPLL